jgi:hypothetical protein
MVVLEPMGSEYRLRREDSLRVTFTGDGTGDIEVVHQRDSITVYPNGGWEISDAVNRRGERPAGLV